ncbi:ABC transporter ATP-binding protein [Micrococcales bacterium 31B]|nr:ABC transporter ATP-binding protein [Micrococcales bacterium 31B]
MSTPTDVLKVHDLEVSGTSSAARIVLDVKLNLRPGEILGVIGESGSGKTTLGLALMRYCKNGTAISRGDVSIQGEKLSGMTDVDVRRLRGLVAAYVPQSPATALNPALSIKTQLIECLPASAPDKLARVREVLGEVALPSTDEFLARYPHQLSGGQQQRIGIAMAFMNRPPVIIMDEPTTGLDVSTQKAVLETVRDMCERYDCAAVYISHDMAVVASLVDRLAVMYSGRVVEIGAAADVLSNPHHPYTRRLILAVPELSATRRMVGIGGNAPSPLHRPDGCAFAPRCDQATAGCSAAVPPLEHLGGGHDVACFNIMTGPIAITPRSERLPQPDAPPVLIIENLQASYGKKVVLEKIDITVRRGECMALLGESGSGKTTLSRSIGSLHEQWTGVMKLGDETLSHLRKHRTREQRRRIQYIFQNPYDSLNPRRTIGQSIAVPIKHLCPDVRNLDERIQDALAAASLRPDIAARFPDQLSGGERQRVAIARALAVEPDVLICDEITSALDVSVQASITSLLQDLQDTLGLTLLFVTHDIALVRNIATQVSVLKLGHIAERGNVAEIFANPQHEYTQSLLRDTPDFTIASQPAVS